MTEELTVATFNVRWGMRGDGCELDLAASVQELGADVVALQEVWWPRGGDDVLGTAAAALGYELLELPISRLAVRETRGFVESPEHAGGSWGLAILTRLPVTGHREIPLGRVAGDVARSALQVDVRAGHHEVSIVNAHLSYRPYGSPIQLYRLAQEISLQPDRWIVLGDLNCPPPLPPVILRPLRRAVRGATWPAKRPLLQLDHIHVGRGFHVAGGHVAPDLGSDHRPVWVQLFIV